MVKLFKMLIIEAVHYGGAEAKLNQINVHFHPSLIKCLTWTSIVQESIVNYTTYHFEH